MIFLRVSSCNSGVTEKCRSRFKYGHVAPALPQEPAPGNLLGTNWVRSAFLKRSVQLAWGTMSKILCCVVSALTLCAAELTGKWSGSFDITTLHVLRSGAGRKNGSWWFEQRGQSMRACAPLVAAQLLRRTALESSGWRNVATSP